MRDEDKITNYLAWLRERGQVWPILCRGASQALAASGSQAGLSSAKLPASSLPKNNSHKDLFSFAGPRTARLIAVVESIEGQKLIFGRERELLINILTALKLHLGKDVLLVGLLTDQRCLPLAEPASYQQQFLSLLADCPQGGVLLTFGCLVAQLLAASEREAWGERNCWQQLTLAGRRLAHLNLWQLQDLLREPTLKRQTWASLRQLLEQPAHFFPHS